MRFIVLTAVFCACSAYKDNPAEELVEAEIRQITGLDIDLTSEDGK